MTARNKVLTIMGIIILIGIISIGFFVFPIGISMCAITGLCYGCKYKDKLFIRWSSVGLVTGIGLSIYTLVFNLVNVKQHKFSKKRGVTTTPLFHHSRYQYAMPAVPSAIPAYALFLRQ